MAIANRYWVVGGEYKDTRFSELRDGTSKVLGPFEDYGMARATWQAEAEATRSNAYMRFTIAREG